ncbi:alpha/beta hydrolase [bacterium]|nr:alpha/beta hydrolase [candidate division CSSED10-310 bacterium]
MHMYRDENGTCFRYRHHSGSTGILVFIHGLGESGLCFERWITGFDADPLLSRWDILIPDLPGYGRSLPRSPRLGLEDYAGFTASILDSLPTRPAVLIGHSMGGVIALLCIEKLHHPFSAWVNIEGNISPGDCVFSGRAAEWPLPGFVCRGFSDLKETVFRNGITETAQRGYYASMQFADPGQFHLNSRELVAHSASRDAARRMAALKTPVIMITGQPQGLCTESMHLLTESALPVAVIEPAGHWPFIDCPETVTQTVSGFIQTIL